MGEIMQGLATPRRSMFVPLALVAITLLPLLDRGRVKLARWIAVLIALAGDRDGALGDAVFGACGRSASTSPTWSTPTRIARLTWRGVRIHCPPPVTAAMPFAEGPTPLPWESREPPLRGGGGRDTARGDHARTRLGFRQHANAAAAPVAETSTIALVFRAGADRRDPRRTVMPVAVGTKIRRRTIAQSCSMRPRSSDVTIEIDTADRRDRSTAYLLDTAYRLPDGAMR